ncbi:STAS domain-containing protein [Actinoplanes sp. CA-030573]|uniref:STAS domain-containing protein n=1 Tax=Actinoplanes sp. CA-030573 TaxID=3239898 RepID=UPI003D9342EA
MSEKSLSGIFSPPCEPSQFAWSRVVVDGADVIYLSGDLDMATVDDLRARLMNVVESSTAGAIVIDMFGVDFIDAGTIGVIMAAWDVARTRGRRLRVDRVHGTPALAFKKLELEPILILPPDTSGRGRSAGERAGPAGAVRGRALAGRADAAR